MRNKQLALIIFISIIFTFFVNSTVAAMTLENESKELPTPISFIDSSKIEEDSVLIEFKFKVLDPDEDEVTLEDTIASTHRQMNEKQYEAELITRGFAPQQMRKYGFAFRGKECLIG